jgi:hypothetical protein
MACTSGRLRSEGGESLGVLLKGIFRGTVARSTRRSRSNPEGASCIGQAKNWSYRAILCKNGRKNGPINGPRDEESIHLFSLPFNNSSAGHGWDGLYFRSDRSRFTSSAVISRKNTWRKNPFVRPWLYITSFPRVGASPHGASHTYCLDAIVIASRERGRCAHILDMSD